MVPKSEDQKVTINVETVLQKLSEKTRAFERATSIARDRALQRTDAAARYSAIRSTMVHQDMNKNNKMMHEQIHSLKSTLVELRADNRRTAQELARMHEQSIKSVFARDKDRERQFDEQAIILKNDMLALVLEHSSKLSQAVSVTMCP